MARLSSQFSCSEWRKCMFKGFGMMFERRSRETSVFFCTEKASQLISGWVRRPAGLIGCPEPLAVFAASCLVSLSCWRDPNASRGDWSSVETSGITSDGKRKLTFVKLCLWCSPNDHISAYPFCKGWSSGVMTERGNPEAQNESLSFGIFTRYCVLAM